jgi:hypothetical protein
MMRASLYIGYPCPQQVHQDLRGSGSLRGTACRGNTIQYCNILTDYFTANIDFVAVGLYPADKRYVPHKK